MQALHTDITMEQTSDRTLHSLQGYNGTNGLNGFNGTNGIALYIQLYAHQPELVMSWFYVGPKQDFAFEAAMTPLVFSSAISMNQR